MSKKEKLQSFVLPLDKNGLVAWHDFKRDVDAFLHANGLWDESVRIGPGGAAHKRVLSSMVFSLHPSVNGGMELRFIPRHEVFSYTSG